MGCPSGRGAVPPGAAARRDGRETPGSRATGQSRAIQCSRCTGCSRAAPHVIFPCHSRITRHEVVSGMGRCRKTSPSRATGGMAEPGRAIRALCHRSYYAFILPGSTVAPGAALHLAMPWELEATILIDVSVHHTHAVGGGHPARCVDPASMCWTAVTPRNPEETPTHGAHARSFRQR